MFRTMCLIAAVSLGLAGPASAGSSYKFQLNNHTTQYTITGFQTFEDGHWTTWEDVKLSPGESSTMDWNTDTGDCVVPFRVIYKEIETEQYSVDWCKIHEVNVYDDKVTSD